MQAPTSVTSTVALALWIPLALLLFFILKPQRAALITIFGGLLFLPELVAFHIPLLPPITKQIVPYVAVFLGFTFRAPGRVWRLPRERWVLYLSMVMLLNGIGIAMTNGDAMEVGGVWRTETLPGLGIKDGMYVSISDFANYAFPFFLGTVIIRGCDDLRYLLSFLSAAALVYAPFALLEIRLSPQLHVWIYGFPQHKDFLQTIRWGGYRPMVFMAHGLAVAMFFLVALLATAALFRGKRRIFHMPPRPVAWFLGFILVLCKSTGAIIYGLVAVPLTTMASPRTMRRAATVIAFIVLLYPVLRATNLVPVDFLVKTAANLGKDRAGSLQFRFENEDALLEKVRQRPWFGWGTFGRNEIFDGGANPVSVTDGSWIISLGSSGGMGFATLFGLLLLPVFLAGRRLAAIPDPADRRLIASAALLVAVTALDLLPNSLFSNYPFFLSGALLSASRDASTRIPPQYAVHPPPGIDEFPAAGAFEG